MSKKSCDKQTQALIKKITMKMERLSGLNGSKSEAELDNLRNEFYIESSTALLEALLAEYDKQEQCLLNQLALCEALDKIKTNSGGNIPF